MESEKRMRGKGDENEGGSEGGEAEELNKKGSVRVHV